ncbi:SCO-spondin [Lingula anatina]|uniref:SCO-spondin n=1 Tax=Lingula anatina TaxID=7574 RepID=A0A1S3GXP6_LINAN|nr:SCO-spondin [Lingula anatina]|eukprot:XP_013378635.1 SCO-spondin [Lingula anatina]
MNWKTVAVMLWAVACVAGKPASLLSVLTESADVHTRHARQNSACSGGDDQSGTSGEVQLLNYGNNQVCEWKITTTAGMEIRLSFESFNVETQSSCVWDSLTVYDGDSASAQALIKMCGNNPKVGDGIVSSGNTMFIRFRSDGSVTRPGFTIRWEAVPDGTAVDTSLGCSSQQTLQTSGTLNPFRYNVQNYPNNELCEWVIQGPTGQGVKLTNAFFNVESQSSCSYDALEVYDGSSASATRIGKFCGSSISQREIQSTGDSLFLRFKSDSSVRRQGFVFAYEPRDEGTEGWGSWSSWSGCSVSCGGGTRTRTRACLGGVCEGDSEQTEACNTQGCPDCPPANNPRVITLTSGPYVLEPFPGGNYANFLDCHWRIEADSDVPVIATYSSMSIESHSSCAYDWVQTYDGTSINAQPLDRKRCGSALPPAVTSTGKDMFLKFHSDYSVVFGGFVVSFEKQGPIDGNWAEWGDWSDCDATCGGGTQSRSRTCTNPPPSNNGADCVGPSSETRTCNPDACPVPVDGMWSTWSGWTGCSVTCGTGSQSRSRTCTNPPPSNGGADCIGGTTESQICTLDPCPIDGGWGSWSTWSSCTVTCGGGVISRSRSCDSPPPQFGGQNCSGSDVDTQECATNTCPSWSEWSAWSDCSKTCGGGSQSRSRSCTSSTGVHDDSDCPGSSSETQACNTDVCPAPVDGGWGEWSAYGDCSVTCGDGTKTRTRECNSPPPANGGADCEGNGSETSACNLGACPIEPDDDWGYWTTWTACSTTVCSANSARTRARKCLGTNCPGANFQFQPCFPNFPTCEGYSEWTKWSQCSANCGGGQRTRTRQCLGSQCDGPSSESQSCNNFNCPVCQPASNPAVITITDDGQILEPFPGANYGANLDCYWLVQSDTKIRAEFQYLGIQYSSTCGTDYLIARDGPETSSPQINKICGTYAGAFQSTQNQILLHFHSSSSTSDIGFQITFTKLCTGDQHRCGDGTCIERANVCDNTPQCSDGSDEPGDGGCGWMPWGSWSSCSVLCGGGTKTRTRSCVSGNPSLHCPGASSDSVSCNTQVCLDCPPETSPRVITVGSADEIFEPWPNANYQNDMDCFWLVEASAQIEINFNAVSIESHSSCAYDWLEFFDGSTVDGTVIGGKVCGTSTPSARVSKSNTVLVKFHSDYSEVRSGFKLTFSEACGSSEYRCDNGQCVSGARCDNVTQCQDGSDEPSSCFPDLSQCGIRNSGPSAAIVGGTEATPHSWPWQVRMYIPPGYMCGGVLITDEWVLTAAHCIQSTSPTGYQAIIGDHSRSTTESAQVTKSLSRIIKHESYSGVVSGYDIALVKLSSPVTLSAERNIACLPASGEELNDGHECWTTGWGTTSSGGSTSTVLREVRVDYIKTTTCRSDSNYNSIADTSVCAGEAGKDACQGDSGGPLVCKFGTGSSERWKLMGLTSWGRGCAAAGYPGVYAKVSTLVDWVNEKMQNN